MFLPPLLIYFLLVYGLWLWWLRSESKRSQYKVRRREVVLPGVLLGYLAMVGSLILLAGGVYGVSIFLIGYIAPCIGVLIYEQHFKSIDTVPKFKRKSKRKLKNEEKPKRTEKPKNGQLPY